MKKNALLQIIFFSVLTLVMFSCKEFDDIVITGNNTTSTPTKEEEEQNDTTSNNTVVTTGNDTTTLSLYDLDKNNVDSLLKEVFKLSQSKPCDNKEDWKFTSYGAKACGGNIGYIPYSIKIDTANFLKKVNEHYVAQDKFNRKYGILSTCDIPAYPTGITCKNGKATLIYNNKTMDLTIPKKAPVK